MAIDAGATPEHFSEECTDFISNMMDLDVFLCIYYRLQVHFMTM